MYVCMMSQNILEPNSNQTKPKWNEGENRDEKYVKHNEKHSEQHNEKHMKSKMKSTMKSTMKSKMKNKMKWNEG